MAEDKKKEIAVIEITEEYMKDRLYEFRGKKVMLGGYDEQLCFR